MNKANMVCHTWVGARDLWNGCPDLTGAKVTMHEATEEEGVSILYLKRTDGSDYSIMIRPAEV